MLYRFYCKIIFFAFSYSNCTFKYIVHCPLYNVHVQTSPHSSCLIYIPLDLYSTSCTKTWAGYLKTLIVRPRSASAGGHLEAVVHPGQGYMWSPKHAIQREWSCTPAAVYHHTVDHCEKVSEAALREGQKNKNCLCTLLDKIKYPDY